MKKTLQKINNLGDTGIIKEYALEGGIAQFYYVEQSETYDLDYIVNIVNNEKHVSFKLNENSDNENSDIKSSNKKSNNESENQVEINLSANNIIDKLKKLPEKISNDDKLDLIISNQNKIIKLLEKLQDKEI